MTFTQSVVLPVDVDQAFALVTEPERLRRWKTITARVELRVGGECRFTVSPGHVAAGTYRELEPGRRVVFGWGWEGDPDLPPDTSTVIVTFEPVTDGTRVTLVHEGLTPEQEAPHALGWAHALERLERVARSGDAGPDEWAAVPDPLDELTAAEAVLAVLQRVLVALPPDSGPRPTPCAELSVAELVEHLYGSLVTLGSMTGEPIRDPGTGSPEDRVATIAAQGLEAWRSRGLEGSVTARGGARLPATFAAGIMPVELLLHAWDLAQASNQPCPVSDELVSYVHKLAEQVVPGGRGSSFADEVVPEAGASALERIAAFSGRQPMTAG